MEEIVQSLVSQETKNYINGLSDTLLDPEKITDKERSEYISNTIDDGPENFAKFVVLIDTLDRSCNIFKNIVVLHMDALKTNKDYKNQAFKIHNERSKFKKKIDELSVIMRTFRGQFKKL